VRWLVGPHPINELARRDRTVDVNQESDEDAPLAGMTDLKPLPVEANLDVAEQPELHRHSVQPSLDDRGCLANRLGA
jgi:hypothetical protein